MKVFAKDKLYVLYLKYFNQLFKNVDTDKAFPDLKVYFLWLYELPQGHPNYKHPHYESPDTVRIPFPESIDDGDDVFLDIYAKSKVDTLGHEVGHYVDEKWMNLDLWQEWSKLTGKVLDFEKKEYSTVTPTKAYPYVQSKEDFANSFGDWLLGKAPHMTKFFHGLWGQEYIRIIELWINSDIAKVDGERVELDQPAIILSGRTLVPLRFISEALGANVIWDRKEQKITITGRSKNL